MRCLERAGKCTERSTLCECRHYKPLCDSDASSMVEYLKDLFSEEDAEFIVDDAFRIVVRINSYDEVDGKREQCSFCIFPGCVVVSKKGSQFRIYTELEFSKNFYLIS